MLTEQLHDSHFWVLVSTLIFVAVAVWKGKEPLLRMLDLRTARIKSDLEQAAQLRAEAEKLLADMQRQHRDAMQTSQKIIDTAKETAARLEAESAAKMKDSLARREAQLLERISRAEAAAVQELRDQAADLAAKSAELLLHDAMSKRGGKLIEEAIAGISAKAG
jgi:F-type H+-transporting ATPase subunit b